MSETTVARAALVIGVNEYTVLDPSGDVNLRGARNDAIAWAVAARALGITDIRLLTSPVLSAADLPISADGIVFGEATAAAIRDGVQWLATSIGTATTGQGMVAYSGHGAEDARGLLLCPTDVASDLGSAIPYTDIADLLGRHAPQTNVTFFLDTCHAAPPPTGLRALHSVGRRSLVQPGSRSSDTAAPQRGLRTTDLVLAACRTNEVSAEAFLQNGEHGAFTWAATAALSRGGLAHDPESGLSFFGIAYRELLKRTQGLLTSLGFRQRPVLEAPESLVELPVMHTLTLQPVPLDPIGTADGYKEVFPEGAEGGSPMGFAVYELTSISGSTSFGYLLVTGSQADVSFQGQSWHKSREYWMWASGQAWSQSGFRMVIIDADSAPTLNQQGAQIFTSQAFPPPSASTNLSINQTNGTWWSISFSSTALTDQIGWLKVKTGEQNDWYEYMDVMWPTTGGGTESPKRWFRVAPASSGGSAPNAYLYFHFASGGPSATTDTHPGDTASSSGQYLLTDIVKTIDPLH